MAKIRDSRPDLLFICGGDGTLRRTVSGLLRAYGDSPLPKIAILTGGTMNTVAAALGIRKGPSAFLRSVIEGCDPPLPIASRRIHPLAYDGGHGFIFAVGGFSNFIARYSAVPDPSPLRAFGMLTRTTASAFFGLPYSRAMFPPFAARIRIDGRLVPELPTVIAASAFRHIGFGFRPFAHAEGPGGDFGTLLLRGSPAALLPHFAKIRRGEPLGDPAIGQFPASDLRIEVDSPLPPMIDGDLLPPRKEFALRRGPALDFVTG
jgi:diacylglycerol kinase family enzyme